MSLGAAPPAGRATELGRYAAHGHGRQMDSQQFWDIVARSCHSDAGKSDEWADGLARELQLLSCPEAVSRDDAPDRNKAGSNRLVLFLPNR